MPTPVYYEYTYLTLFSLSSSIVVVIGSKLQLSAKNLETSKWSLDLKVGIAQGHMSNDTVPLIWFHMLAC